MTNVFPIISVQSEKNAVGIIWIYLTCII